ncbi:hypothetical protein D3C80_1107200 [compost metagenome]
MHLEAAGGHQLAVLISLERAVAGIGQGAVRHHHLEKALPLDGDVLAVVGLRQVALAVQTLGRHRPHAGTDLQSGRQRRLLGGLRPRLTHGLVQQIFEHCTLAFKTVSADVGQVVGDHVHIGLLRIQTGFGNP